MKLKSTLLFLAVNLQILVYSQTNPLVKYLPDDLSLVVKFDLVKLISKIPAETFRQSPVYRELMKDPGNPFSAILTEPLKTGVDFSSGLLVAVQINKGTEPERPTLFVFGKLFDAGRFTASIQSLIKDKDESITQYGTDRILFAGGMTMGWNNNIFVMTSGYGNELREEIMRDISFSDTMEQEPADMKKIMEKIKRSQRELCFELLTPKSQNTFSTNLRFAELMNTPGDIKIWNTGAGNPITNKMFPLQAVLSELQEFTAGTKTAIINFEDGKIVVQSHNYLQGEILELYKKYPSTPASMDFVQRLPAGKLLGLINTSFNAEMSAELFQKGPFGKLMDSVRTLLPFDLRQLQGVFKTRMTLAVVQTDETNRKEGIQVIAAVPIADKIKFGELSNRVKHLIDSIKAKEVSDTVEGETRAQFLKSFRPVVQSNDELIVFSLSAKTAETFLNNTGAQPVPAWMELYRQYPVFVHIDMQAVVRMMFSKTPERLGMNEKILFDLFDKIIIYGGGLENERLNTTMEFRFGNQTVNALTQLFNLATSLSDKKAGNAGIKMKNSDRGETVEVTLTDIKQEKREIVPPPPPPPKVPKVEMKKYTPPVKKKN